MVQSQVVRRRNKRRINHRKRRKRHLNLRRKRKRRNRRLPRFVQGLVHRKYLGFI
jgi:hypothetical protein